MMVKRENTVLARVDDYILNRINEIVDECKDLNITKSEVVYTILKAYFILNPPNEDLEKLRDLIIRNRKGTLNYKSK